MIPSKFLSDVLPAQGSRVFAFILPGPDGNRPTVQFDQGPGVPESEVDRFTQWAIQRGADSYVAIGGYGPMTRTITQGKNAGQLRIARRAENALWHRCLRLDLDVYNGPDLSKLTCTYRTRQDAWQALKQFIQANNLPLPSLVNSGAGLHAYFLFDRDIDLATWQGLAALLANATAASGLMVDSTTTQDAARILRLPGTWNFKTTPPLEVKQIVDGQPVDPAYYDQQLAKYALLGGVPHAPLAGARPIGFQAPSSPLTANLHPPYTLRGVLLGCPGMSAKVQDHGAQDREPLWHATLALVNKAADDIAVRERVARALSQGHPAFTEYAFQAKWAQVQQQDYEPPTCEKFAGLGMPQCQGCPLRHTHKSPVVLGRAQPAAPQTDAQAAVPLQVAPVQHVMPSMPMAALQAAPAQPTQHGIFQITPGVNVIQIVDGQLSRALSIHNGVPTAVKLVAGAPGAPPTPVNHYIGSYQILQVERLLDTDGKMAIVVVTFNRHADGQVKVELDHTALASAPTFNAKLAAAGLHYNGEHLKLLQDKFMPEFLSQLQRIRQANAIAGRCGWTPDFQRFVLGTMLHSTTGAEAIRSSSSMLEMEAYHQRGDEALWADAFNMVLDGGHDRQAIIALGLAAPLMAFSGVDGVLLNAYSPQSGVGKSTLCDAILSVWGSPDKLRKDFRDTASATFHLAAISGNLPMVIDEFTNVQGPELSNYIYTITQGRERHRLGADSKLKENGNRWCLPWIATSNLSVHAKLQSYRQDSMAEAARVFEMRLFPLNVDPMHMGAAKAKIDQLKHNYGFLGPKLVQLFLSKPESYWRDAVMKRIAWWDQQMAMDTSDRFRSVIAALMDIGAALGSSLGYRFDRNAIIASVQTHWRTQIAEYEMSRIQPADFVASYIAEHINKITVFGGENGDQALGAPHSDYAGEIHGITKHGKPMQVNSVRIPLKNLKDYVTKNNGDFRAVQEWLTDELRKGGMVKQIAPLTFLNNTPRTFRLRGVQFTAAVLGHASLQVVSEAAPSIPPLAAVAP